MKITYNLMTNKDVNGVFNISNACFSMPWSIESIEGEINNPLAKYIVARDEDSNLVVGFVGIWIVVGEGSITNIAVHPDYRKQGIGAKLLESLINLCTHLDCSLINLEVRASNYPAQNLYEKYGFVVDGLRKGYYEDNKEDAILMTKYL
ncbi:MULTISPECIES: ribosomal protein S18-alanine N-acetyltransferase [unclassified Clostridium]|jgi:ribosomal-protein-alanine acetyltransferase|uniref:ribosomal protein S18-alanine N-acetyltransferase n=1 Tax=unclassified Clostridium TaxID=2614128 RepID=UPI0025B89BDB|nr:ribosomal protein S18-alanine N-acetyltransferase [Clostridium sp.]MCI6692295.1 ribosomal protein S18-alanine N-acetyltransferase [Clostridium sp.]MDY2631519.1 ribosomal protein S18-alanine N-acetyltransferase [Clostridium sp.]MDY4252298.1 ribosomal protein S18-alanine N-acetyltransferase [Clostridium sp.]